MVVVVIVVVMKKDSTKKYKSTKYKSKKVQNTKVQNIKYKIERYAADNKSSVWAGATMDNRRLARSVISGLLRFRRGGGWSGGLRGDIS